MKSDAYTLAIVIPCWNEEKLLPETLDCLLKQTFQDWRAYCVDDRSTDRTADIVKAYQAKDSRIQYVCRDREPKGGQTCRNIGVELAKGAKYLIFFDADDMVAPYCFELRVKYMETHPELDFGVFPIFAYRDDIHEETGPVFGVKTYEDDLQAMIGFNVPFHTATNIYRYDSSAKTGIKWDEKVKSYQDVEFNIQVLLSGMKYAYATVAKADYFYRYTTDGVAGQIKTTKHFDSHVYMLDKVTRNVSTKYGKKYDFCLEAMIVNFLGRFRNTWWPYFKILSMSWMKGRFGFKLRILMYMAIFKTDRRLIFRKYRKYSKRQNAVWIDSMARYRKELLERGVGEV